MAGAFAPWHIIVLVVVVLVLFGAKRLPDSARALGRSLRILQAETRGLRDDDRPAPVPPVPDAAPAAYRFDPYTGRPLGGESQPAGHQRPVDAA